MHASPGAVWSCRGVLPTRDLFAATKRWKRGSKWIRVQARFCLCFIHTCPVPIFPTSPPPPLCFFGSAANCIMVVFVLQSQATWIAVLSTQTHTHTQKHTDKLIILKKQRPGAHLAYFPRQHWDVGRGIEFRGGCSCTLGNIQYSKCDAHKHSLCIVNLRPHLPQITSPHVRDNSLDFAIEILRRLC